MRTISITASKGGVGKTTITAGLAVAALLLEPGARVAMVDADPQGSLTAWWNERRGADIELYERGGMTLPALADALRRSGVDYLLIDTAPGISAWQREAIRAANLALVPCQPCAIDLAAIAATEAILAEVGKPSACVLNRAMFRTRIAGQAVRWVRGSGRTLLPVLHQRVDVGEAISVGRTAMETKPNGAAAREMAALWGAVRLLLPARRIVRLEDAA